MIETGGVRLSMRSVNTLTGTLKHSSNVVGKNDNSEEHVL
jgi:hypothetical protein